MGAKFVPDIQFLSHLLQTTPVTIMKAKTYETANVRKMAKRNKGSAQQMQEFPVNNTPSNAQYDNLGLALFIVALTLGLAALVGGGYYTINQFMQAVQAQPVQWMTAILMTGFLLISLYTARTLVWLGFFGTVMMCSRMGAWKRAEETAEIAIKLDKFSPNGTGWASMALSQSLLQRGLFKESLAVAESEWQRNGTNPKQAINMGPLCACAAMANQVEGNVKQTLAWNERALTSLNHMHEEYSNPQKNKGMIRKLTSPQSKEWLGQIKMQLAATYFNNATIYMNSMDHRRAKESFKKAVEMAVQAPDFPQKADILKVGKEQLGRLKHS